MCMDPSSSYMKTILAREWLETGFPGFEMHDMDQPIGRIFSVAACDWELAFRDGSTFPC